MSSEYTDPEAKLITGNEWLSLIEARKNPFYKYPEDPDQQIWRYMDVPKLISLFEDSSIFFPRADQLGDPFEGSLSMLNQDDIEDQRRHYIDNLKNLHVVTDDQIEMGASQLLKTLEILGAQREWERRWTYISCWHANDHESAAMWRLYSKSDDVIAVQSTFRRLFQCLRPHRNPPPHGEPTLGMVYYIDPQRERVNTTVALSHFFHKFKSFQHEKELRAVFQALPTKPIQMGERAASGITIAQIDGPSLQYDFDKPPVRGASWKVDLQLLIERIYVSPYAAPWFADLVSKVVRRYSLSCPVERSILMRKPIFTGGF